MQVDAPQPDLNMSRRFRRTPFTAKAEEHGARGFSIVNHVLLPNGFQPSIEDDYWHLREHVQIWDVSCQRQVDIAGKDAERLIQWMTPRDIGRAQVGQCLYAPLLDDAAGIVNDPILLKLADNRFWLSIGDCDVLLWAKGLALGAGMEVSIHEPDVWPLAVQGPKAEDLMARVFGEGIREVRFFRFATFDFRGSPQIVSRSGYSKQGGFEIYLANAALGPALWDAIWEAGQAFNIRPGCPNLIERIEGGFLAYGNEMTRDNNPLECGLDAFCRIDGSIDFIGRDALQAIARRGARRLIRGVAFEGDPCPPCTQSWPVLAQGTGALQIGQITSGVYSPRLRHNIGLSMIERGYWDPGGGVIVRTPDGQERPGALVVLPFQ